VIRIDSAHLDPDPQTQYSEFGASRQSPDDLGEWVQDKRDQFFASPSDPVKDLIEVLQYPPPEDRTYGYPTKK
jgi:hypothetical protein